MRSADTEDRTVEARAEMHRTLTLANLTVLTDGGHGVEGHTLVSELRPDCVLLGVEAPVERGLQTLEAIVQSLPSIPVIVYSSLPYALGASVGVAPVPKARAVQEAANRSYTARALASRAVGWKPPVGRSEGGLSRPSAAGLSRPIK